MFRQDSEQETPIAQEITNGITSNLKSAQQRKQQIE